MEKSEALNKIHEVMNAGGFTEEQKKAWEREAAAVPLLEGETYHFKTLEVGVNITSRAITTDGVTNRYVQFKSEEDTQFTMPQIARLGNGLGLTGSSREDLAADFVSKVNTYMEANPDSEGFVVKVKSLKTRPGRNGMQIIPTFALAQGSWGAIPNTLRVQVVRKRVEKRG